jgi:hypothetical protein
MNLGKLFGICRREIYRALNLPVWNLTSMRLSIRGVVEGAAGLHPA